MAGALLAPDVLADVVVLPIVRGWTRRIVPARLLVPPADPQTLVWRDFKAVHADGWVGPVLVRAIDVPEGRAQLQLRGAPWSAHFQPGLTLAFFLDGHPLARHAVSGDSFAIHVPLAGVVPGRHELRIEASACVVPDRHLGNHDHRPLAYRLDALEVAAEAGGES